MLSILCYLKSIWVVVNDIVQTTILLLIFDPSSPGRKLWRLSAASSSAVANALSLPPGEYARKSETQRN